MNIRSVIYILKIETKKNVYLISDSFIPQRISSAGMIYNLSRELIKNNFEVTCVFSGIVDENLIKNYDLYGINKITTNFLSRLRNKSLFERFVFEVSTAFILAIKCFFYRKKNIDLVIWYGPSVFLWIVVKSLTLFRKVPVYYILRDIFPDWLIHLRIIKNPILIFFLEILCKFQYTVSDVVGVETIENVNYLLEKRHNIKRIEVFPNWPNIAIPKNISIDIKWEKKFEKFIIQSEIDNSLKCLYVGNLSVAHDYESLIEFFDNDFEMCSINIGILSKPAVLKNIKNKFLKQHKWDLVENYQLPHIFSKIDCGIVTLNRYAIIDNIPGKFVSYTQYSLPIICFANKNSALAKLITKYDCGVVIDVSLNHSENWIKFLNFVNSFKKNKMYLSKNSSKLFKENFETKLRTKQILNNFNL